MSTRRRPVTMRDRAVAGLVLAIAIAVSPAAPASAHPFGAPPTMDVEVDGDDVVLTWRAATDDLTALAGALGLVAASQTFVYDADGNLESGPAPEAEQLATAASAPPLDDYVADRVAVRTAGAHCPVTADTAAFPVSTRVVAQCPSRPDELDLEVTLLQDLHPAYRTVVTSSASGDRLVLTSERPRDTLVVATPVGPRAGLPPVLLVALALGALLVVAVAWWRRRPALRGEVPS